MFAIVLVEVLTKALATALVPSPLIVTVGVISYLEELSGLADRAVATVRCLPDELET